jgi:hypothetical protein
MKTRMASIRLTPSEREFFLWATLTQPRFRFPLKRKRPAKPELPTEAEIQRTAFQLWSEVRRSEKRSQTGLRGEGTPVARRRTQPADALLHT